LFSEQQIAALAQPDNTYNRGSVVDSKLRVHGVENLRVCDASAIGKGVVGHTDGPTRMVGLNCARMIMEQYNADMPLKGYGTNVKIKPFHIQYYLEKGGKMVDTAKTYNN